MYVLLTSFRQIYSENQEQSKTEQNNLENLQFGQKRTMIKTPAKEGSGAKKSSPLRKKSELDFEGPRL
jgi:hypothetical protein